jgi:hypothetical protein
MAERAAEEICRQDKTEFRRVSLAYRRVFSREPTTGERDLAHKFLSKMGDTPAGWTRMIQALLASAEFRYVN